MKLKPYIYAFSPLLVLTTFIMHSILAQIREEIPKLEILPEVYAPLDAIVFLTLTFFSGLILLLIFKRSILFLKLILSLSALYMMFFTAIFYWDALSANLKFLKLVNGLYAALVIVAVAAVALFMKVDAVYSSMIFATMVGIGCILNFSIRFATKIALMIVYSIFDIYSVYRGVLGEMFKPSKKSSISDVFSPLLVKINGLSIGSGDVIFYSMASSLSIDLGIGSFIAVSIALFTGFAIDIWLLKKRKVVPGLPAPIILSLITILICRVISP